MRFERFCDQICLSFFSGMLIACTADIIFTLLIHADLK